MPPRYLDRDDWRNWAGNLFQVLAGRVNNSILRRFDASAGPSWIEWLSSEQSSLTGDAADLTAVAREFLESEFRGIRVFHATRLTSLDVLRESGLIAWSAESLAANAREALRQSADAEVLESAISACNPDHRAGRVYTFSALSVALGMHNSEAEGTIPSFAAGGGEFIEAVARKVGVEPPDETGARTRGYILACDLPWGLLTSETINQLAEQALMTSLVFGRLNPDEYRMAGGLDCVPIAKNIPAEAIALYAETDDLIGKGVRIPDIAWKSIDA